MFITRAVQNEGIASFCNIYAEGSTLYLDNDVQLRLPVVDELTSQPSLAALKTLESNAHCFFFRLRTYSYLYARTQKVASQELWAEQQRRGSGTRPALSIARKAAR